MVNEKVAELLNTQVNKEFYSAYLYLAFSNYFSDAGLDGFANWYQIQAQEERDHAMLFVQYMQNNDIPVTYEAIEQPKFDANEHIDILKAALNHERYVTGLIRQYLRSCKRCKGFPYHAVFRLVRKGAGGRGDKRF